MVAQAAAFVHILHNPLDSDPSYRGQLGEGTEGPRGRGQGGSSLEGGG